MKKISFLTLFIFTISVLVQGQTTTNVQKLNSLSQQFAAEWEVKQQKVKQYVAEFNVPVQQQLPNGTIIVMVDVVNGKPVYYSTDNLGAAATTRADELWEGGSTGLNLSGEGYDKLGEWDVGAVRDSHQEFTDQGESRVTQVDDPNSTGYHATHVAGTMIAAGINFNARGMAYGAQLKAYHLDNDFAEMAAAAADGMELSNHSYGPGVGWENYGSWVWIGNSDISATEDYEFGFYNNQSRQIDQIAYNAPYYLICRSAGNERGEGPGNAGQNGNPQIDGGEDGYDCIQPVKLAKNVLSVGAVNGVPEYSGPESVVMSSFSSWGPADDGRIKPDIVGKGVSVFSTRDESNTAYGDLSGTSMSTPNVTGTLALLQYYYQSINDGSPMRAATLRALALHTTDEAGDHEGPDYKFGWGLMNAERAVGKISEDTIQNVMEELVLQEGDTYSRMVNVPEGSDLRVTICWTDPAGTPVPASLNPRDPMLVNDLDLSIVDENNTVFYPYKLDPDNPSAAATTDTKNNVDNVEMVFARNLPAGTYTIIVDHDDELTGGEQAFSIIVTGIDEYMGPPLCTDELLFPENGATDVIMNQWISWQPADYATSYNVYFGTDGGGTETPSNVFNGENFTGNGFDHFMDEGTTYYLQIVPQNSYGTSEDCEQIWSFTTNEAIDDFPYLETMMNTEAPDLPTAWQSQDLSTPLWFSIDQIGHDDVQSMACVNPEGLVESEYDNWFISLPFEMQTGKEYNISYYYKNISAGNPESMSVYWGATPYVDEMTNLLSSHLDFDYSDWNKGEALLIPETDGNVFIGWHAESDNGYGIFLDEILIEDYGTVGIEDLNKDQIKVFSSYGNLSIVANEEWLGADVRIINIVGQTVHSGILNTASSVRKYSIEKQGLYIVSITKGDRQFTKKLLVN